MFRGRGSLPLAKVSALPSAARNEGDDACPAPSLPISMLPNKCQQLLRRPRVDSKLEHAQESHDTRQAGC